MTYLIVGLGNPGKEYEKTRHNLGFLALEEFWKSRPDDFSPWQENKKFSALLAETAGQKIKIILLKPQTFMNRSGEAVARAAKFYKIKPENIWVIHDDLDLPLGKLKIQQNRGAAGHKGAQSIMEQMKTANFVRFRLGIAPLKPTRQKGADFVLSNFAKNELPLLNETLSQAGQAILKKIISKS